MFRSSRVTNHVSHFSVTLLLPFNLSLHIFVVINWLRGGVVGRSFEKGGSRNKALGAISSRVLFSGHTNEPDEDKRWLYGAPHFMGLSRSTGGYEKSRSRHPAVFALI